MYITKQLFARISVSMMRARFETIHFLVLFILVNSSPLKVFPSHVLNFHTPFALESNSQKSGPNVCVSRF